MDSQLGQSKQGASPGFAIRSYLGGTVSPVGSGCLPRSAVHGSALSPPQECSQSRSTPWMVLPQKTFLRSPSNCFDQSQGRNPEAARVFLVDFKGSSSSSESSIDYVAHRHNRVWASVGEIRRHSVTLRLRVDTLQTARRMKVMTAGLISQWQAEGSQCVRDVWAACSIRKHL